MCVTSRCAVILLIRTVVKTSIHGRLAHFCRVEKVEVDPVDVYLASDFVYDALHDACKAPGGFLWGTAVVAGQ